MSRLTIDLTVSLDGHVAGPDPSLKDPLGVGGERLHESAFAAMAWQEAGTRLFDDLGDPPPGLALDRVIASPAVTHLRYKVAS